MCGSWNIGQAPWGSAPETTSTSSAAWQGSLSTRNTDLSMWMMLLTPEGSRSSSGQSMVYCSWSRSANQRQASCRDFENVLRMFLSSSCPLIGSCVQIAQGFPPSQHERKKQVTPSATSLVGALEQAAGSLCALCVLSLCCRLSVLCVTAHLFRI